MNCFRTFACMSSMLAWCTPTLVSAQSVHQPSRPEAARSEPALRIPSRSLAQYATLLGVAQRVMSVGALSASGASGASGELVARNPWSKAQPKALPKALPARVAAPLAPNAPSTLECPMPVVRSALDTIAPMPVALIESGVTVTLRGYTNPLDRK